MKVGPIEWCKRHPYTALNIFCMLTSLSFALSPHPGWIGLSFLILGYIFYFMAEDNNEEDYM